MTQKERDIGYTAAWRRRMIEEGRCRQCGSPARVKSDGNRAVRCLPCELKQKNRNWLKARRLGPIFSQPK